MSSTKQPWHMGTYPAESAKLRAAAYANPATRCWRCRLTLDQIRQVKPRARWTAGHINDAEIGGKLLPECSPCNYRHGALKGNRSPKRRRAATWRPRLPVITADVTDILW